MKKLTLILAAMMVFCGAANAQVQNLVNTSSPFVQPLISAATTTGAGTAFYGLRPVPRSYQATVTGTGAVSATVYIEVSTNGTNWLTNANSLCTITLSGTTSATGGCAVPAAMWPYIRANVSAISGTGAAVTVNVGG